MTDANDNEPWTETCVRDLKLSLKAGNTIEEAASFLCRSGTIDDVRRKADELGADLAELKMAKVGRSLAAPLCTNGVTIEKQVFLKSRPRQPTSAPNE